MSQLHADFGIAHLIDIFGRAKTHQRAAMITVDDEIFPTTGEGIVRAAEYAKEVDDRLFYRIGKMVFAVIYDGPYTAENAAEIIQDTNEAAEAVCGASE